MGPENPFKPDQPTHAEPAKEPSSESRDLQAIDVVRATEIAGFGDLTVVVTLEKKKESRGKQESRNQDFVLADPKTGLVGVFDGLGALKDSDVASRTAALSITSSWDHALASWNGDLDEVDDALIEEFSDTDARETMRKDADLARKSHAIVMSSFWANQAVRATGSMTTACVGFIHTAPDGTRWLVAANVGDGGAFVRHADGRLVQATMEDSSLSRAVSTGALPLERLYRMKLDPSKKFPIKLFGTEVDYFDLSRSIPEPLGSVQEILPLLTVRRVRSGDEILFCTDGIIDKYENVVTEIPPEEQMTADQLDTQTFGEDASDGETFLERVDNLRIHAGFRQAYKITDDSAIVGVKIPEDLNKEEK